ncbi:MAG: crossover junction endodeoxyribonuclease RuvC [Akkermansia sp.]|nr:crossover junction endodeoxyribonuclease RuvC [Akkermansia sp.]
MIVLSIDPAIRNTGYAVLEGDHRNASALEYGTLSLPQKLPQSRCLLAIHEKVCSLIEQWHPDELAIEGIIYVQSHRTAITMGSARAATVLAAARYDLPIMEYPPTCVKLATVGRGGAGKQQVAFMMRAMLRLTETPAPDAADALAIGFTHLAATDPLKAHVFRDRRYI